MAVDGERIYNLAIHCKELFAEYTSTDLPSAIDIFFREYEQRFLAWSAYMGVFADQSMSLDSRLKGRSDISDLVIRLLDLLAESLVLVHTLAADGDKYLSDEDSLMDLDRNEFSIENGKDDDDDGDDDSDDDGDDDVSKLDQEILEIIETALVRLSRLGTVIRQSLDTSRVARIREFTEKTMVETYAKISYKRSHQQKLNTLRKATPIPRMSTIHEKPDAAFADLPSASTGLAETSESIPLNYPSPEVSLGFKQGRQSYGMSSESNPSTLGSISKSLLQRKLVAPRQTQSQYLASSVQLGKVTYPPRTRQVELSEGFGLTYIYLHLFLATNKTEAT
ncbi:hypothetical protein TWF102_003125 [Orbilia oligospora]|uniref:Uncharacterized protein n=1 Tax=Orbilia oligospora TaxID=2813651 RepID=A0A7C8P4J5_ORBOL|nr:hypothetical protein TWF102_003125 [Orbilia oligospora]KAF3113982.1 hypothetical protein TWF706_009332 [Orbilia oligospora]KAF3116706.1 hypothetical protein TWF103_008464 [Orbilia oligospora]KAF3128835.1 hypothetical protein TWF703_009210 [Orbilia oligospora]